MPPEAPSSLIDQVWTYPLFEALYGRRSRRFGRGFEIGEGPFRFTSQAAPVALGELEEALLVGAGAGFSGLALWDLATPAPYRSRSGRTFPTTIPGGRTALFFTNDAGFYVLDDTAAASKLREIETADERGKILATFRERRRELRSGRLDIPRRVPPYSAHDLWDSNRPGSTLFLPVVDVSAALISLIAQFVDPALRRYAPAGGGWHIVDDRFGSRPAGTERWLRDGFLDASRTMPLSLLERQACYYSFSEPAAICQNMLLAAEAIGLGGWKHCGFLSLELLERMGFRIVPSGPGGFGNPIGLDGVFEARCPPYYPSMDDAVDSVLAPQARRDSISGAAPHRMPESQHRAQLIAPSEDGIACTKAVCRYIHETYGRFPGGTDAMHLMWIMQAHHLDTEFYDRFFRAGAYGPTHAAHMAAWHGDTEPR
jgi:nitroreductase